MKNLIFILLTFNFVLSCNKENTVDNEDKLIGKWQLVETCEGGTPNGFVCTPVENGYFFQFNEDGVFNTNWIENTECSFGTFQVQDSKLYMEYNIQCEVVIEIIIQNYVFENHDLILSPLVGACPEGCTSRFKRINIGK